MVFLAADDHFPVYLPLFIIDAATLVDSTRCRGAHERYDHAAVALRASARRWWRGLLGLLETIPASPGRAAGTHGKPRQPRGTTRDVGLARRDAPRHIQSTRAEGLRPAAFSPDPQSQSDGAIRHKWSEWVLCFHADVNTVSQRQAYNKWMTDETERLAFTARHPAIARRITVYTEAMPMAIALDIEAAADGADRTTQLYAGLINHLAHRPERQRSAEWKL